MPWTTPPTEVTGYTVTATDWNNYISANPLFLYGDSGWTNVASFSGSWAAGSPAPAYMLMGRVVYLRGVITTGTGGTAAFTLPSNYRPSATSAFPVSNGAGTPTFAGIVISTAGVVTPGQTTNIWLSGVSFPVA